MMTYMHRALWRTFISSSFCSALRPGQILSFDILSTLHYFASYQTFITFLTHARFECHIFSACTCSVELHPIVGVRPGISAVGRGFIQWFPTDLESPDETDWWKGEVLRFWGLDGNLAKTSPNCSNFGWIFESGLARFLNLKEFTFSNWKAR